MAEASSSNINIADMTVEELLQYIADSQERADGRRLARRLRSATVHGWARAINVPYNVLRGVTEMLDAQETPYYCERGRLGAFLWLGKQPKSARALCGARTRKGTPCQARVVDGRGRCRMHGGLSTGAKTAEGRARISESNRRRADQRREQSSGDI